MNRKLFCLLGSLSLLLPFTKTSRSQPVEFDLGNGLHVILQRLPSAKTTALVVLYDIGNQNDPAGHSGMAHLAEHLYVTAATSSTPARTVQQYIRAYPKGWNAQTGDDYTVIATVFEPRQLDDELADAADRMKQLLVTNADLQREIPRMEQELDNMYERIPSLAARNLGREQLKPLAGDGRRGGKIEQLKTIRVEQVQAWLDEYYKPNNATIALVGPLDPDAARQMIEEKFADLPAGKQPNSEAALSSQGARLIETEADTLQPGQPARVGITFAAPQPDDEQYPAFLIHVARLQMGARQLVKNIRDFPVAYMPVDQPGFLFVTMNVGAKESAEDALKKLREFVGKQTGRDLTKQDPMQTKNFMGLLLGTMPERFQAQNPYGAAFSLGRRHQMNIDAEKLVAAIENVSDQQLKRAQQEFLSQSNAVTVVVKPTK